MTKLHLLKVSAFVSVFTTSALLAQTDSSNLDDHSESLENKQGLIVYEIKSQGYVESTAVSRGEGKLTDYYDQNRQDEAIFSDGELSSITQMRVWKLSR